MGREMQFKTLAVIVEESPVCEHYMIVVKFGAKDDIPLPNCYETKEDAIEIAEAVMAFAQMFIEETGGAMINISGN